MEQACIPHSSYDLKISNIQNAFKESSASPCRIIATDVDVSMLLSIIEQGCQEQLLLSACGKSQKRRNDRIDLLKLRRETITANVCTVTPESGNTYTQVQLKYVPTGKVFQKILVLPMYEFMFTNLKTTFSIDIPPDSDLYGNDENIALEVDGYDRGSGQAYPPYIADMCMVKHARDFESAYLAVVRRFQDPNLKVRKCIINMPEAD